MKESERKCSVPGPICEPPIWLTVVGAGGRGDEFLGRAGAGGAGQDGGRLVVVY